MEVRTLADADIATAVAALERAYTGYFIPIHFTVDAFERYIRANDIDLAASAVWIRDGRPAAIGVTGIRGKRGWIGAFGVAPEFRGKGLAQAAFGDLVRRIKRRGVSSIQLEVLDQNERAIAIYARAGFKATRKLYTLQSPDVPEAAEGAQRVEASEALDWDDDAGLDHCWQREPRSLALRLPDLHATRCGASFCIFRADAGGVSLLKTKISGGNAEALFAGVAAQAGSARLGILNEPEGSPLLRVLADRSWTPAHAQYEMRFAL